MTDVFISSIIAGQAHMHPCNNIKLNDIRLTNKYNLLLYAIIYILYARMYNLFVCYVRYMNCLLKKYFIFYLGLKK